MSNTKTYKILCLHGYRQDSKAFKTKSGGFRKLLKNYAEFEFIDAPNVIPEGLQNPNADTDCLSWWFSGENPDYFSSLHESDFIKGFEESIKNIQEFFETKGPFDGVLAFSQGAALVVLLCILSHFNEFPYNFKFVILVSAFKSLTTSHLDLFERLNGCKMNIPSLHIIGETDQVIDRSRSESLAKDYFHNPTIVFHSGGHVVLSQSSYRSKYLEFFENLS